MEKLKLLDKNVMQKMQMKAYFIQINIQKIINIKHTKKEKQTFKKLQ